MSVEWKKSQKTQQQQQKKSVQDLYRRWSPFIRYLIYEYKKKNNKRKIVLLVFREEQKHAWHFPSAPNAQHETDRYAK